jgi:hypothetical protein
MKIITNDYGCGTSSSIVDYETNDVIIVSEQNHSHLFDVRGEDLLFIGHDFLLYLWNNPTYFKHWQNYKGKKIIWCFEKIDCMVPAWKEKSHYSLSICQHFTDQFYSSDEQDCRKYGIKWLPQWASRRFFDQRLQAPQQDKITFSGQAGSVGYEKRDDLLTKIANDADIKDRFYSSNTSRTKSWDDYIVNFLNHKFILAPFGNFKGFNTRTYEALTSGRVLLQQIDAEYKWHMESISTFKNVVFFETFDELKNAILNVDLNAKFDNNPVKQFEENSLFSRLNLL